MRKKQKENKQSYNEDICRRYRESFSREVDNYKGNRFNKDIKKENFKKNLMNLFEKNHSIHMTPDNSISSSYAFKNHLNIKGFDMFSTL